MTSNTRYAFGIFMASLFFMGGCSTTTTSEKESAPTLKEAGCAPLPAEVLKGAGLYIGELHGTRETPELLVCLVKQALAQTDRPIIVSLELPPENSPAWPPTWAQPTDGRTSQAMADMIKAVRKLHDESGRVTIDYQLGCPFDGIPADPDAADNKCIGETIRTSMTKGFVIAFGGSSHAARLETPIKTAAAFLPPSIKTVEILVSNGGTAWGSFNNAAPASSPIQGRSELSGLSGFIPGRDPGFDYGYVIKDITASYPASAAP